MPLSDQQKTQLADLYDEAQKTGDTRSMQRIRTALQDDINSNPAANAGTDTYFDIPSFSFKQRPHSNFIEGLGQRFVQAKNALRQISDYIGQSAVDPNDPQQVAAYRQATAATQADIAEHAQLDKPLNATPGGQAGNMVGSALIASSTPAGYAGAAAGGALAGATTPTTGDESRTGNALVGAGAGVAGQAVGQAAGAVLGRIVQPIQNAMSGVRQAAADLLKAHGIPLDLVQTTGDRLALTAKNAAADSAVLNPSDLPEAQRKAFTGAALKFMGVSGADEASPAVMQQGRQALKDTYNAVAARNSINVDLQNPMQDPLLLQLHVISHNAEQSLVPDQYGIVKKQLENIVNAIQKGDGKINGTQYQGINDALDRVAGDGGKKPFVTDIRQALTAALQRSSNPQDAALLAQTDRRWSAMKSIQGGIGDDNQISPSALFNAMDTKKGQNQTIFGQGANPQLAQLAQAGKLILGRGTPNSGTPQRLLGAGLFGAAGGFADSKLHGGSVETPVVTLAAAIGGPALARSIIENPTSRAALTAWARSQGITTMADVTKYLAAQGGRAAGVAAAPAVSTAIQSALDSSPQ